MSDLGQTPGRRAARRPGFFSFFPMRWAEGLALAVLVAFSVFCFLPRWREVEVSGMALFGWLMAGLMLASPVLMLIVFHRGRGR